MKIKTPYQKVMQLFFSFPEKEFGLNEIVKKLKISKTTANKVITQLIKENFIKRKIIGKNWLLSNNTEHDYNKTRKIIYNLELLYSLNILKKIENKFPGYKCIILFGSYRKGDDTEKSDMDIAVEISGEKNLEIEEFKILKQLGYRKDVQVNLHIFSRKKISPHLFSNIANGIILQGFLEVHK
jgi:predicted nucleotidyltransferase